MHHDTSGVPRATRRAALAVAMTVLATGLAACSSTNTTAAPSTGSRRPIPASAFTDHTGVTPTSVTVANISTQTAGLFRGGLVGAQAYADYVNSTGGVQGRKIVVQGQDDGFNGSTNKQLTQAALTTDFATVADLSLEDGFGGTVFAANPGFPNVSESLDPVTQKLPNTFSAMPAGQGWPLGPLVYFAKRFPTEIAHTGSIVADLPATVLSWTNEKAAMTHLGYHVAYETALPPSTVDFTAQVVAMRNAGVQIAFLEQMPENYATAFFKDLVQQNFHPTVVVGSPTYSSVLVANSGGPGAVDGTFLAQQSSLFLGEDASAIPAVATFDTWVAKTAPGFQNDLFAFEGWVNTELFVQALRAAGPDPSRGSLLRALQKITAFDTGNIIPVSDPARRVPISCYLLGEIKGGVFTRMDDPPISGPTHGYRCDQPYYQAH